MSYFRQIPDLPTYPEAEGDFRFSYNANSGGGQSFLAGKYKNIDGALLELKTLDEKNAVFKFVFRSTEDADAQVILDDTSAQYLIKPRAHESRSMKLEVSGKVNPSKALTAFLMLPEGCTIMRPAEPSHSVLAKGNYWLQTMKLSCDFDDSEKNIVYLIPTDLVFSGGNEVTKKHFKLDLERRIRDIIAASNAEALPHAIRESLRHFADIYIGSHPFRYEAAKEEVEKLMHETALHFPTRYSGIDDPLPAIVEHATLEAGKLVDVDSAIRFKTGLSIQDKRNIIIFGAPGTGKSKFLDQKKEALLAAGGEFERVTFHPDYSYAHFVGTYKPVPKNNSEGKEIITYEYVPGPFMRVLAAALKNGKTQEVKPQLLLIEEINRASAAAVFGDVFQLLDRNRFNVSEYPIHPSVDIQTYLAKELGGLLSNYDELRLPDNMFIWGSMNSADQGVFPMDTAFKRRWDFMYLGIDDNEADLVGKFVTLGKDKSEHTIEWNELRRAINNFLAGKGINEDKQIGPYFLSREVSVPHEGDIIKSEPFVDAFQQKVLMYLFEDAARHHRASLFAGCDHKGIRYSDIRIDFERKGVHIFNAQIVDNLTFH